MRFIRESLVELDASLRTLAQDDGCGLIVLHAVAGAAIPELSEQLSVQAVYASRDDEPFAFRRDARVRTALAPGGGICAWSRITRSSNARKC